MTTVAKMAFDPQSAVLAALREQEYLPVELMAYLEREKHLKDAAIKSVILDLLQQMKIEFAPNQKLRLRVSGAKAPLQKTA